MDLQRARDLIGLALWACLLAAPTTAAADDNTAGGGVAAPFAIHGQFTDVTQGHPGFRAPYEGPNSLASDATGRSTNDVTLYLGLRLWKGAEVWVDPELDQGFGLSNTLGVAGFPSGEAYKVGAAQPYFKWQRAFVRQTIDLGGDRQTLDGDLNVLGGAQAANRLVFTVGKLSVVDIFDTNKYAHDPRNDFLNWTVIDTGTFDYAADAWGYTYGAAAEWYQGDWTLRGGVFDLSVVPNSSRPDPTFRQFQLDGELERRYQIDGQPGAVRITGFLSRGRMAKLADATALAEATGQPPDLALVRHYAGRPGVSVTAEQQISEDLGVFARAGIADGAYEAYEFTDVDRTIAVGAALSGKRWGRADDTVGLAGVVNVASSARQAYLAAGGLGILVGDGRLPHPGAEGIVESYYEVGVTKYVRLGVDYQCIVNPAFNTDRGPVSVFGLRIHVQR
jgi:high affinity Mn2+ porin